MMLPFLFTAEKGNVVRCTCEADPDSLLGETTATVTREAAEGLAPGARGGGEAGTGGGTKVDISV